MLMALPAPMHIILFVIVVAVLVTFIIGYYMRTKNQERISLIEKGINPDEGHSISEYRKQTSLKNGVLFIAFGLGLFSGYLLDNYVRKMDTFVAYVSTLLLFGGIGFLINYFIMQNQSKEK